MLILESSLRKIIQKVILEHEDYENESGDIHPDFMEMFEWYQWAIIHMLEYWEGWKGLDYKFIEGQVKKEFPHEISQDAAFEKKHNHALFDRALYELVASETIDSFWGEWHPKNDLDHDHSQPDWMTPKETRELYALPKGHQYQDDFVPYKRRRR